MAKRKDRYTMRPDGRYMTLVADGTRKPDGRANRIPVYGKTSKELEEKVAELKYLLKSGQIQKTPEDISVRDYAGRFIDTYKSIKEMNTVTMYRNSLRYTINPTIGEIRMAKLLTSDIQYMITENREKRRTCEIALMFMRQLVRRAVRDGILPSDICEDVELPPANRKKKRALSDGERQALFHAPFRDSDRVFLYLLYGCGLRREEVIALNMSDIGRKGAEIYVRHVLVFDGNKPLWKPVAKSDGGMRTVPVPKDIQENLQEHLKEVRKRCRNTDERLDGLLFPSHDGGFLTKSGYRRMWERIMRTVNLYCDANGLERPEGLTAHIFRHNYATMLYYSDISIKKAAELMGHSSTRLIMEVYAHLDEEKENAREKIDVSIRLA